MTIDDQVVSSEEAVEGVKRLRWAIHPFAGHPMAQRRWVQMGHMQRSAELLEAEAGGIDGYVAAGALSAADAAGIGEVVAAFDAVKARREDLFYDQVSAPRDFLWTGAFEEDEWSDLRAKARRIFGKLSNEMGALIEK